MPLERDTTGKWYLLITEWVIYLMTWWGDDLYASSMELSTIHATSLHSPGRCRGASRGWRARCRRSLPSRSSSGNKSKVILVQVVILDSLKTKKKWVAYLKTYFGAIWGIPRIIRDPLWGIPRIIRDSLWGIPRIIRDSLWGIPRIKQIKALDEP